MNKVYNWSKNSLAVVCPTCSGGGCESCSKSGIFNVGLRVEILNKTTPCCDAPWIPLAATALKEYECSKCHKHYESQQVIGHIIDE